MDIKKDKEQKCLESVISYINNRLVKKTYKYINSIIPMGSEYIKSERPDFIMEFDDTSFLVEHFMIDYCYDGPSKNQSQSKLAQRDIGKIYSKYHDSELGTIRDDDIDMAANDIEQKINNMIKLSDRFDYTDYVKAFYKVFHEHYKRISEYKKNSRIKNKK